METMYGAPDRPALLWYFAYGSNMSSQKFIDSRGIFPHAIANVKVPGWRLAFNIPGLPYAEPAFTSIVRRQPESQSESQLYPDVIGVAYLITHDQYIRVLGSEGGGIAYDDTEVTAMPIGPEDAALTGPMVKVRTLGAAMKRHPCPRPSKRYMVSPLTTTNGNAMQDS